MSNQTSTLIQTPTGIDQNKKYNVQLNTRVQQTYKMHKCRQSIAIIKPSRDILEIVENDHGC
jgi:hypothetical protein